MNSQRVFAALLCLSPLAVAAQGVSTHLLHVAAPANGDAAAKSLVLFDDGRVAFTALAPRGGDSALFRFDAEGLETGRWLGTGSSIIQIHNLPASALAGGLAGAPFHLGAGWEYAIVDADGRRVGGFPLAGPLSPAVAPVATGERIALVVEQPQRLVLHDTLGATLGTYQPAPTPTTSVPLIRQVASHPAGGFIVLETLRDATDTERFALRRLDAALATQWSQDFSAIAGAAPEWQHVAPAADGSVLLAGSQRQPDDRSVALLARVDAAGALSWHRTTASHAGRVDVAAYRYADGFGFLGVGAPDSVASCLLQGRVDADGSNFSSSCYAIAGKTWRSVLGRRLDNDGLTLLLGNGASPGLALDRVSRTAAQPPSVETLLWASALETQVVRHAMSAHGVAIAATTPGAAPGFPHYRLLRWEGAGAPVVDTLLPAADADYRSSSTIPDGNSGALFNLLGPEDTRLVRLAPGGALAWQVRLPARGFFDDLAQAQDGSFRTLRGAPPALHAVSAAGAILWSHEIPHAIGDASVATLGDGSTLLGYGDATDGFDCRVRKFDADGVALGDASLGVAELGPSQAISLGARAVFVCGRFQSSALERVVVVDAGLQATLIEQPGCIGQMTHLGKLQGERWVLATLTQSFPSRLTFCSFDGTAFRQATTIEFAGFLGKGPGHGDALRGRYHVPAYLAPGDPRPKLHIVYDDTANHAEILASEDLPDRAPFGFTAPDSLGRVLALRVAQEDGPHVFTLAQPGEAAERSWTFAPENAVNLMMSGDTPYVAFGDRHAWDGVVHEFHALQAGSLFTGGFEQR